MQAENEWRRGWSVVLAAAIGYGFTTVQLYSFGALVKPLQAAFGWSRGEITGPMLFVGISGLLLNPLAGKLVGRLGARRVALSAIWAYAGALVALGLSGPALWSWYLAWALLATLYPFVSLIVWTTPVVDSFRRYRGLALGALACGAGLAGTTTPLLTVVAVQRFGWRGAYFTLAGVSLLFVLSLAIPFFRSSDSGTETVGMQPPPPHRGQTLGEAIRTVTFWVLAVALTVSGGVAASLLVHLQPLLIDSGAAATQAAAIMALMGPAQIVGRLGAGFLLDRLPAPLVAGAAMSLPAFSIVLLLERHAGAGAWSLAAVMLGAASGAEVDAMGYMTSRYFGLQHYASVYGAMLSALTLGFCAAPVIVGFLFDAFGTYRPILLGMIPMSLAMSVSMAGLWRYRARKGRVAELLHGEAT